MSLQANFAEWPMNKFKYSALTSLFLWRRSSEEPRCPYRDAKCKACGKEFNKAKPEPCVEHAPNCPLEGYYEEGALERLREQASDVIQRQETSTSFSKDIDVLLTELIAVNLLPINLIASKELKKLLAKLAPQYKLPSRKKFYHS